METRKVFTCQQCDAEMEVDDPRSQDEVVCRSCGALYRLMFSEDEQAWILLEEEPVEPEERERHKEEPFTVLDEVGRPKKVDRSEEQREQSDVHADEDIAIDRSHIKS